jgi:hypothetical protein
MHYLAQKVKQGKANMGQNLHSIKVMAKKLNMPMKTRYLSFYLCFFIVFMLVPFFVFVIDDRFAS